MPTEVAARRFVQLERLADPLSSELEQAYVYLGAMTKTVVLSALRATMHDLGALTLMQRRDVEDRAKTVPIHSEVDGWGSHNWVKELLSSLVVSGIVSGARWDDVLSKAADGMWFDCTASASI